MQFNINERTKSLKETNHALLLSENIIMKTSKAICITDMHSTIIKVNESFYKLTGFKQDEIIGQNPRFLKSNRHTADFYKKMKSELNTTGIWSGEIWNKKKNGEIHPIWLTINAIYDKYGIVQNYIGLLSDISNLKQAEEQVTKLAIMIH